MSVPEGIIFKKCSLEWHKPATNKACAAGDCQHTCPGNQIEQCPHAWTLRYSVKSRQHEQSFRDDIDPANGQVKFGSGKARARAAQLRLAHRKRAREPALAAWGDGSREATEPTRQGTRSRSWPCWASAGHRNHLARPGRAARRGKDGHR